MSETDYEHLMRLKTMATRPELWQIKDEATVNCLRWALEQIERHAKRRDDYKGPTVDRPTDLPPPPPMDLNGGSMMTIDGIYEFELTAEDTDRDVIFEVKIPDEILARMKSIASE